MSDTDSDELSHSGHSESESERPGNSSLDLTHQLGVNVCSHSVNPFQNQPPAKVRSTLSPRSAHYTGNRVGNVPSKEAESCKGEELVETQTLTTPRRNTPPTLFLRKDQDNGLWDLHQNLTEYASRVCPS